MDSKIQYINSITKAFEVLQLFSSEEPELGIREIGNRLAMNNTTVYRIAKTLELNGILIQNPTNKKYFPGYAILEMAHRMFNNFDDKNIIYPYMNELLNEFNEDIVLSVLNGTNSVCIERLESNNGLRLSSRIGRVLPLSAGATGKVFLPFLSNEDLEVILLSSEDRASLERDIKKIKNDGYITSISELDLGVYAIAVPIVDSKGKAIYSLGVCGSVDRIEIKGVEKIIARLLEISNDVLKKLQYLNIVQR